MAQELAQGGRTRSRNGRRRRSGGHWPSATAAAMSTATVTVTSMAAATTTTTVPVVQTGHTACGPGIVVQNHRSLYTSGFVRNIRLFGESANRKE